MGRLRAIVPCAAVLVELGCASPGAFECQADAQCEAGRCEPNGWCSFPDDGCASGHRYGEHAGGGLAGTCVDVDDTEAGTGSGPPTTGPDPSTTTVDPSIGPTGDASSSTGSEGDESPPASCGDGVEDPGEACDDGNMLDGDGCDADCTPSGETVWDYVFETDGTDVARDVLLLADGRAVVCGDALLDGVDTPAYAIFSADGEPSGLRAIGMLPGSDAWGIASLGELIVVGGTRAAMGDAGFVALVSEEGDSVAGFTVPPRVYDVAARDELVWVSGQLEGGPYVAAYSSDGTLADELVSPEIPAVGTAWDLALGEDGSIYVAASDGTTEEAWLAAAVVGQVQWTQAWPGAAFGVTLAAEDALVVSGGLASSGVVSVVDPRSGAERWSQSLTSPRGSFANIHKAAGGPSGEIVGVGWVSTSATDADIWVGKYAADGTLLWERTFAGTGDTDSNGWGVVVDAMGFITAVGGLANVGTGYDAWVVRLEP